jgi:hypothetical protein
VAESGFGAKPKFVDSSEWSRLIRGGWIAYCPTELVAGSIYTHREWWSRIWMRHTAVGGEEEPWAR